MDLRKGLNAASLGERLSAILGAQPGDVVEAAEPLGEIAIVSIS